MPKLDRLQPVELRDIWPNEAADFTPWLAKEENLTFLGETLHMELELEAQEINVGDFRADILCQNIDNGSQVLIENQFGVTNHDHLGKILTYSAGLDARTIIWIAEEFRDEHLAALNRLNEITDNDFRYFGIEIKVWQIGESDCAPQFDIVSKPNDWKRTMSRGARRVESEELSERQVQNIKFWTELREYMNQKGCQLQCPSPGPRNYLMFGIGKSGFNMDPWVGRQKQEIGIRIYVKGQNATAHFHLLMEKREEIESEFGEPLEWDELPENERSRISLRKEDTDPTDETDWPSQHEWFASKLELFDKAFRHRIKTLNADDWEPLEDEDDE